MHFILFYEHIMLVNNASTSHFDVSTFLVSEKCVKHDLHREAICSSTLRDLYSELLSTAKTCVACTAKLGLTESFFFQKYHNYIIQISVSQEENICIVYHR